ncbi:hypothetical protein ACU4M6_004958 [Raoultella ornithinolytica]|uniref:hypothetical protein n=1 Tax=Raoultella TaxID=160674 RepID=UPI0011B05132|nr:MULTISPECIES: hypothetical protein [Raoultella]EKR9385315.1 hypothetical protein [Raoultella ornithinolytica]ELM7288487.1 hypothetical protein [Raoultella ornithinolytica]ELO0974648.1 hypothetical protein [Raoultella ornithinolytica]MEB7993642.1 hypothetical protein [Raoultella ornithinolytica]
MFVERDISGIPVTRRIIGQAIATISSALPVRHPAAHQGMLCRGKPGLSASLARAVDVAGGWLV